MERNSSISALKSAEFVEGGAAGRKSAADGINHGFTSPNAGNIGSAAYLSVFESMFHTLAGMKQQGYTVDMPDSIDAHNDTVAQLFLGKP